MHEQTAVKAVAERLPDDDLTILAEAIGFKAGLSPYISDTHLHQLQDHFRRGAIKGMDMRERGVL
jgi:hypothetical protein